MIVSKQRRLLIPKDAHVSNSLSWTDEACIVFRCRLAVSVACLSCAGLRAGSKLSQFQLDPLSELSEFNKILNKIQQAPCINGRKGSVHSTCDRENAQSSGQRMIVAYANQFVQRTHIWHLLAVAQRQRSLKRTRIASHTSSSLRRFLQVNAWVECR